MDQQIKEENKIQNYCLNEISSIQKVLATLKSKKLNPIKELLSNLQSLIQPFKLSNIEQSKQAVLNDDVRWNISLYEGQPFVYTSVNDRNDRSSHVNLSNSDDNDVEVELDEIFFKLYE
ncbi:11808_t:CDS:2 [Rhizophagus irregularis]|nr:11808_t:CDS:2 [Rhizophagus irregularis]